MRIYEFKIRGAELLNRAGLYNDDERESILIFSYFLMLFDWFNGLYSALFIIKA